MVFGVCNFTSFSLLVKICTFLPVKITKQLFCYTITSRDTVLLCVLIFVSMCLITKSYSSQFNVLLTHMNALMFG